VELYQKLWVIIHRY